MKKLLCLLLSLIMVLVLGLTGCSDNKAPADSNGIDSTVSTGVDGEIAYVSYYTGIPYWNDGLRGLEDAAQSLGIKFDRTKNFYGPQDGSGQEQARIIDELVAKGVKGIIVSPVDNDSIADSCKKAMDAGIPIILVISSISDETAYYGAIGASNRTVGLTGGKYICEAIGEKGKVGIITIPGVPVHDERTNGYLESIEAYPNVEVVQPIINTDASPDVALQRAQALIQSTPDLAAIIATDSVGGAAAAKAVKEAGKTGEIKIIGMDRDEDLLGYIEEGVVTASVASKSFSSKWLAMHYMYWILNDQIKDVSDMGKANVNPMPKYLDTEVMIIDKDNVNIFLEDLKE